MTEKPIITRVFTTVQQIPATAWDALLAQQNMRALEVFATLQQELGQCQEAMLVEQLHALQAALQQLDFVAARAVVAHLQHTYTPEP